MVAPRPAGFPQNRPNDSTSHQPTSLCTPHPPTHPFPLVPTPRWVGGGNGWAGGQVGARDSLVELKIINAHFMVFLRYRSHIQDFQDLIRRISRISWHLSFGLLLLGILIFYFSIKRKCPIHALVLPRINLSNLVNPKPRIMGLDGS